MKKHKSNYVRKVENLAAAQLLLTRLLGKPACREKNHAGLIAIKDTLYSRNLTEEEFYKAKATLNELKRQYLDGQTEAFGNRSLTENLYGSKPLIERLGIAKKMIGEMLRNPDSLDHGTELLDIEHKLLVFSMHGNAEKTFSDLWARLQKYKFLLPPDNIGDSMPLAGRVKTAKNLADELYEHPYFDFALYHREELASLQCAIREFYVSGVVPEQDLSRIESRLQAIKSYLPRDASAPERVAASAAPIYAGRTPEKAKQFVKSRIHDLLYNKNCTYYLSTKDGDELSKLSGKIAMDKSGERQMPDAEWLEAARLFDTLNAKIASKGK